MVNYQKGKIYTIRSRNSDKVYIGSTCNELRKRFHDHKLDYKYWVDGKRAYTSSFEVFKDGMCYIELLEKCPCNDKNELLRREGQLIRNMDCVNKIIAGRTLEEYYQDNKELMSKKNKEYYENNKEDIKEYNKEWKENNKEHLKEYRKKYYQDNKEKIKEYYQKNKEEYNKKQKEKITCGCGSVVSIRNKAMHTKSKKHKTWEEIQNIS